MAMRVLSPGAVRRTLAFVESGAELPPKITEHKVRVEDLIQAAERRAEQLAGFYQEEIDMIVSAKRALDVLYGDFAEGIERTRWCDLPEKPDLTPDDILREAVYSTESVYGATGVEVLATYLDTIGHDALTRRLATRLLAEVRPLLEEALLVEGDAATIFADPRGYFRVSSDEEAIRLVSERFIQRVNQDSPKHVTRAMVAYIEFGLDNYVASIRNATFAQAEKGVQNFKKALFAPDGTVAEAALLCVERRKAEILIELLRA